MAHVIESPHSLGRKPGIEQPRRSTAGAGFNRMAGDAAARTAVRIDR